MKSPTLKDVARSAGVSLATASYAMREDHRVSRKTREKILQAADRLGYSPNRHAASLRKGESKPSRCQVAMLHFPFGRVGHLHSHPHVKPDGARSYGVDLEYARINGPGELAPLLRRYRDRGFEGLLLYGPVSRFDPDFRELTDWEHFSVLSIGGTSMQDPISFVSVEENFFCQVAFPWREAVRRGYRRIGCVQYEHPHQILDDQIRRGAVLSCQQEYGKAAIPSFTYTEASDRPALIVRFKEWLKEHRLDCVLPFSNETWWWLKSLGLEKKIGCVSMHAAPQDPVAAHVTGASSTVVRFGTLVYEIMRDQIALRHRGLPEQPYRMAVEPIWHEGETLPWRSGVP